MIVPCIISLSCHQVMIINEHNLQNDYHFLWLEKERWVFFLFDVLVFGK